MSAWIDFKSLRSQLDFEQVLHHYRVEVKRKGTQHHGFCPLPSHEGKKNSPSFSANLERGIFQCFGCGAKGNVLEFAALMERISLEDGAGLRRVALELAKRFCPNQVTTAPARPPERKLGPPSPAPKEGAAIINPPLDFELKGLDPKHPYLLGRGFTPETIVHFGLGFCGRGLLQGRVAIPLHDSKGRLIGYAGRVIEDKAVSETNPRYRFPSKRDRDGKVMEFRKTRFLYNGFRIQGPVEDLIVVEGFTAVWWLHQHGLPQVVATMGSDISEKQVELVTELVRPNGRLWVMPDGGVAGERFAEALLKSLSVHRPVRWVRLAKDQQPTDLSMENLRTVFRA
jgi:DNA primase